MGPSDLNGFLTGIVVGPDLILPSEWLPVVWGGEEPEFETEDEMRLILGTIMGRYNEIVACFSTDPDEFDPIFWEGPEDEVIASDWVDGFLDAVALCPEAWTPLMEDDDAGMFMVSRQGLYSDLDLEDDPAELVFWAEVPDIIPTCIIGMHEFWRNRNRKPVTVGVARSRRRRNGGGRK